MIIARFYWGTNEAAGGIASGVMIDGAVKTAEYQKGGWFPIESFEFGFQEREKKKDEKPKGGPPAKPAPAKPGGTPAAASGDKEKEPTITIKKKVDKATCNLMWLAMIHRTADAAKGDEDKISVDIHVLSSVQLGKPGENSAVNIFPNFMIHLEHALLTTWSVSGSGDDRPDENLALKYDQVAIKYLATAKGGLDPYLGAGWDQTANKYWPGAEDKDWEGFDRFIPKP